MTREEAIEVLKDIFNYTRFDTYTTKEARNMAIKALEQEPQTGHWIISSKPLNKHGDKIITEKCSICGSVNRNHLGKYCSDCGAKMIEPLEREERNEQK